VPGRLYGRTDTLRVRGREGRGHCGGRTAGEVCRSGVGIRRQGSARVRLCVIRDAAYQSCTATTHRDVELCREVAGSQHPTTPSILACMHECIHYNGVAQWRSIPYGTNSDRIDTAESSVRYRPATPRSGLPSCCPACHTCPGGSEGSGWMFEADSHPSRSRMARPGLHGHSKRPHHSEGRAPRRDHQRKRSRSKRQCVQPARRRCCQKASRP
jgi:hypothetical protein